MNRYELEKIQTETNGAIYATGSKAGQPVLVHDTLTRILAEIAIQLQEQNRLLALINENIEGLR